MARNEQLSAHNIPDFEVKKKKIWLIACLGWTLSFSTKAINQTSDLNSELVQTNSIEWKWIVVLISLQSYQMRFIYVCIYNRCIKSYVACGDLNKSQMTIASNLIIKSKCVYNVSIQCLGTCKVKVYRNCIVNDFRKGFTDIVWNSQPIRSLAHSNFRSVSIISILLIFLYCTICTFISPALSLSLSLSAMLWPQRKIHLQSIQANVSIISTRWSAPGTANGYDDHAPLPNGLCLIF